MIWLFTIIALLISVSLNGFLIWFAYNSMRQIRFYDDELRSIVGVIENFVVHLESVHEMEMFYGDETLRHLIRHSKDIVSVFRSYGNLITEEEQDDNGDDS